jgi:NADH-ubiquinone oxidoreductase chain 4L
VRKGGYGGGGAKESVGGQNLIYSFNILKFLAIIIISIGYFIYKIHKRNMNLSLFLFLIGILGFILNRKNIILMIIAIEIMLLSVTLLVLISSFSFDDGIGQTFSIFIISIAGAESVIGLSILVAFYRLTISLLSDYLSYNKPFVKFVNKSPLPYGLTARSVRGGFALRNEPQEKE